MATFTVVALTGPCAGSEVLDDGAAWRGDLPNARALKALMQGWNDGFGFYPTTYIIECLQPAPLCRCDHHWSEHDAHGCFHSDGCTSDWSPA